MRQTNSQIAGEQEGESCYLVKADPDPAWPLEGSGCWKAGTDSIGINQMAVAYLKHTERNQQHLHTQLESRDIAQDGWIFVFQNSESSHSELWKLITFSRICSPLGLVHSLSWIGGQAHLIHLGVRLSTVLWGSWIIRLSDQNCLILAHS